jgi:hypothetical protein
MAPVKEPWNYKESFVTSLQQMPENVFGFVYKIHNLKENKSYIGKKVVAFNRKKKLTKKELQEQTGPGRKSLYKIVTSESDWATYFGSNKLLLEDIKKYGQEYFRREILEFAFTKKHLTYLELKYQCVLGVLESPQHFYNDNILGKFFTRDLEPIK